MLKAKKDIYKAYQDWLDMLTEGDKYDLDNHAREEFEVCIDDVLFQG